MISIIVPVYDVAAYLDRCVNSLVKQTYADLEIILVDDGSKDDSGKICDEWAARDRRIRVVHKANGGLSDARNAGIEAATGDYIGFVDSDDWIAPDMYQDLLQAIQSQRAEMAATGIARVYDNGFSRMQYTSEQPFVLCGDRIVQAYLQQGKFSTAAWDKLYIRELFERRRFPVGKQYEDAPVIFDILCNISRLAVVGKPQYNYYQRADSICGKPFSIRKMDHYDFSKEIWRRAAREYPQYVDSANVFWGCKLCELLYALIESPNAVEFKQQKDQMKRELRQVYKKVLCSAEVPKVMKLKTLLLELHLAPLYIRIKALRTQRAS